MNIYPNIHHLSILFLKKTCRKFMEFPYCIYVGLMENIPRHPPISQNENHGEWSSSYFSWANTFDHSWGLLTGGLVKSSWYYLEIWFVGYTSQKNPFIKNHYCLIFPALNIPLMSPWSIIFFSMILAFIYPYHQGKLPNFVQNCGGPAPQGSEPSDGIQ